MKEILLTQGKVAIVDDDDFERVNQFKWQYKKNGKFSGYAVRTEYGKNYRNDKKDRKNIYLHKFIFNTDQQIDHINRNCLDNRKCNLRPATQAQNVCNNSKMVGECSSIYKGVSWIKKNKSWQISIQKDKKFIYLGTTRIEVVAAHIYDYWAKKLHGEFACLNFQEGVA